MYSTLKSYIEAIVAGATSNNDFSVEHTGVAARPREGTLELAVKYDQETFDNAWAYLLAESRGDNEGEQITKGVFN